MTNTEAGQRSIWRSYKVEVQADSTDAWYPNGLRFPTIESAEAYARDLMSRWTLIRAWRVVESADEPNRD